MTRLTTLRGNCIFVNLDLVLFAENMFRGEDWIGVRLAFASGLFREVMEPLDDIWPS